MASWQLLLLTIMVSGSAMLIPCQGCDPLTLGEKGYYEFCKSSNNSKGIGYKYWEESAVFCFGKRSAFAGDEALAYCPSGYEIKGALKSVCQKDDFWVQEPPEEQWPTCKVVNDAEAAPSRPVVTVMYVIGILAYASGYVLMGLTECHREHIFGRKSTAACLTCLPWLGLLTIAILILWFFTESFTEENDNPRRGFHCLYAALAMSLLYMICSGSYLILVCHEQQRKSSCSTSSRENNNNITNNPYIDDTRNSMSIEFKNNTPLLNGSPEDQCEPSAPPPQYDTLAHHNLRHQLEESAPPSYERAVNLRY